MWNIPVLCSSGRSNCNGSRAGIRPALNNLDRWVIQLCWEPRPCDRNLNAVIKIDQARNDNTVTVKFLHETHFKKIRKTRR
jgi:hypothetical protein